MPKSTVLYPAAIFVLGFLAYANSLDNGFTFDDFGIVVNNPAVVEWRVGDILGSPYWHSKPDAGLYRPFTVLTFALNHLVHGLAPFGYHLVNVVVHLLNATLLLWISLRVLKSEHAAGFAALLFLLHPVQTEAVNGIVGRAELLAAFWVLLAWILYTSAGDSAGMRQRVLYSASICTGLLGCFAKEQAALLVVILAAHDAVRLIRRGFTDPWRRFFRYDLAGYTPYAMMVGLYLALRRIATGAFMLPAEPRLVDNPLVHLGPWERTLSSITGIGRYVGMMVWPHPLSADYAYDAIPAVTSVLDPAFLASILTAAAGCVAVVGSIRRRWSSEVGFCVFFMAVLIIPVSNLFFTIGTNFGERLLYLPSVGFCLLIGMGYRFAASKVAGRRATTAATVVMVALCVWAVRSRNPDWRDNVSLFTSAVEACPGSARAHHNLGNALRDLGDAQGALAAYDRALAIYPGYAEVHYNTGVIHQQTGETAQAAKAYTQALAADSTHVRAWTNLGTLLGRMGRFDGAVKALGRAKAIEPGSVEVQYNFGLACQQLGRRQEAAEAYEFVLAAEPDREDAAINLGTLYTDMGYNAETIAVYRRLLAANPRAYRVAYNLGVVQERLGASKDAVQAYKLASGEQNERGAYALFRAGELYRSLGQVGEARTALRAFLARWQGDPRQRVAAQRMLQLLEGRPTGAQAE